MHADLLVKRHLISYRLTDKARGEAWTFEHYFTLRTGGMLSPSFDGSTSPNGLTLWSGVPFTYSLPIIEPGTFEFVIAEIDFLHNLPANGLTHDLPFSWANFDITSQAYLDWRASGYVITMSYDGKANWSMYDNASLKVVTTL